MKNKLKELLEKNVWAWGNRKSASFMISQLDYSELCDELNRNVKTFLGIEVNVYLDSATDEQPTLCYMDKNGIHLES